MGVLGLHRVSAGVAREPFGLLTKRALLGFGVEELHALILGAARGCFTDPAAPAGTWSDAASWRASAAAGGAPGGNDLAPGQQPAVVARHVFYNRSAFDGNDAAPDARDDDAVAADKSALLPGRAAGPANYTSFARGLNGIMIDVNGLPGLPTPGDFIFQTSPDPRADTWVDAPAPLGIRRRVGAGAGASWQVWRCTSRTVERR